MKNKLNATKLEINGIVFDSRFEAQVYEALLLLEQDHVIENLELQVPILLIPSFVYGKSNVRKMEMIVDFRFMYNNTEVYFESKGFKTAVYDIKLKVMKYLKKDLKKLGLFTYIIYSGKVTKTLQEQVDSIMTKLQNEKVVIKNEKH